MMRQRVKHNLMVLLAAFFILPAGLVSAEENVSVPYLFTLSNFSGILPVSWVDISVDESRDEVYVLSGQGIKIFNDKGMEVYSFNEAGEIGAVTDVAADDEGNIIVISNGQREIVRCNYRGEQLSKIELKNLPPEFSGFFPNRVFFRKGSFYFASLGSKQVIVTDREGLFKDGYDIAALVQLDEGKTAWIPTSSDSALTGRETFCSPCRSWPKPLSCLPTNRYGLSASEGAGRAISGCRAGLWRMPRANSFSWRIRSGAL